LFKRGLANIARQRPYQPRSLGPRQILVDGGNADITTGCNSTVRLALFVLETQDLFDFTQR